MKKRHLLAQEFIGKKISVIDSTCKSLIGLQGEIINETKNTFVVKTLNGVKKIVKNQIIFVIDNMRIDGKNILKRPEERLKMRIKNE